MFGEKKKNKTITPNQPSKVMNDLRNTKTSKALQETVMKIKKVFGKDNDFSEREVECLGQIPATIIYLNSITDKDSISREVLKPLTESNVDELEKKNNSEAFKQHILKKVLYHADVKTENSMTKIVEGLLRGRTILVIDGHEDVFLINTFKTDKRSITQAETEQVIRGVMFQSTRRKVNYESSLKDGKPEFKVKADVWGVIREKNSESIRLDEEKTIEKIESIAQELIEKEFDKLIKETQEKKSDIFGFGEYVRGDLSAYWDDEVETTDKWKDVYKDMKIEVNARVHIDRVGMKAS